MPVVHRQPPHLVAGTRFFDAQVLSAVSTGIPQVVICAAGYDDRALRFWSAGVRFFEIDHPAVQASKAQRLRMLMGDDLSNVVLAPADVRSDEVGVALDAAGHDSTQASLIVCEALLVYLHRHQVQQLLATLRGRAAADTVLTASLATHPEALDSGRVAAAANARHRHSGSEAFRTILPAPAWLRMLAETGWCAESMTDVASLEPAAPPGMSLLLVARPARAEGP
jgi:methyltransferase (TIGR00027 family)